MSLFDEYLFVDWSAANGAQSPQPRADAVWIGELVPGGKCQLETYHRTRESGVSHVARVLQDGVADQRRVLVGFDFPYGYPDGFSIALDLPSGRHSWWMVWAELAHRVRDTSNNENNRFTAAGELNAIIGNGQGGPFWGAPVGTAVANLGRLSPGFPFRCPRGEQLSRLGHGRRPGWPGHARSVEAFRSRERRQPSPNWYSLCLLASTECGLGKSQSRLAV